MTKDRSRLGTTLVALALAAAWPAAASAQAAGDDASPFDTGNGGIVVPQARGFNIAASIRTLYDGNILRRGDGVAPRPGYDKSDFRFTPLASASYALPFGRQQLYVGGDYGRDFYAHNDQLNKDRYTLGGGVNWRLGNRCTGNVAATYKRRQSLLSEVSLQTDNTQEIQDYTASGDCTPAVGLGFGGNVSRSLTDNDNPDRRALDSRDTVFGAHLSFGTPGLGRFSAGGSYSRISYPRRSLFVSDGAGGIETTDDELDIYQGTLGYNRSIGARFTIGASASYIRVKPNPDTVLQLITLIPGFPPLAFPTARTGYSGPGFNLTVDYHPSPRLSANFAAGRNVTSSSSVGAQFVVRDDVAAEVDYKFGPSIDTSLGASWNRRNYKGSFALATANPDEPQLRDKDAITRVFARASYSPRDLYGIDLEVAHQWRRSDPSIYNFSSTSVSLTLRVKFGRG